MRGFRLGLTGEFWQLQLEPDPGTPGGLDDLSIALSRMPAEGLRDPEARRLLSARFDSVPV